MLCRPSASALPASPHTRRTTPLAPRSRAHHLSGEAPVPRQAVGSSSTAPEGCASAARLAAARRAAWRSAAMDATWARLKRLLSGATHRG